MIKDRLAKTRKVLKKQTFDALLISSPANITYLTGYSNFSKDEREAFVLIAQDEQFLLTDGRYAEAVRLTVPDYKLIEVSARKPMRKLLQQLIKKLKIERLGIEEKNLTVYEKEQLFSHYNDTYHYSNTLESLRLIKEQEELQSIDDACQLADEAFAHLRKKIKHGITETFLAFELELFIKKHGADISFPPIVAFGENSSIPHHKTENRKLRTSDTILLDFGVKIDNYCSDMTRTVFFGKASDKQRKMYNTVLTAQQKAIEFLSSRCHSDPERSRAKGGRSEGEESPEASVLRRRSFVPRQTRPQDDILAKDIDRVAREYIESKGFPTIPHSLGHGIGLEVHEAPSLSPRSKDKLVPGMVFSVEPGIYIPGFGGVRIEDLVVLEESGPRLLTTSPKYLIEL